MAIISKKINLIDITNILFDASNASLFYDDKDSLLSDLKKLRFYMLFSLNEDIYLLFSKKNFKVHFKKRTEKYRFSSKELFVEEFEKLNSISINRAKRTQFFSYINTIQNRYFGKKYSVFNIIAEILRENCKYTLYHNIIKIQKVKNNMIRFSNKLKKD